MRKSHPLQNKFHTGDGVLGLHAEVHACIGVSAKDLQGARMVVARILHDGSIAMAKPCSVCSRFLASVGVESVIYTTNEGIEEMTL